MRRAYVAAIVLGLLSGCGSASGGFTDSGVPMQTQLLDVAKQFATWDCTRRFACMPYASETRAFGDTVADCTTEQTGYQTRSLEAPGVSTNYAQILKCVDQMKTASCQEFLDSMLGGDPKAMPDCTAFTPGTVVIGGGCAYDRQCVTGYCQTLSEGQCGSCAKPLALSAPCSAIDRCDPSMGAICDLRLGAAGATCVMGQGRGATCNVDGSCFYNLICDATTMTCGDPPGTIGAMCDPTHSMESGCSFADGAGIFCNAMTMMCEMPSQNALGGAACGVSKASGGLSLCGVGYLCDGSSPDGISGKCIQGHAAPPGSPCAFTGSPVNGPACQAEALCMAGTCKVVDAKTCP